MWEFLITHRNIDFIERYLLIRVLVESTFGTRGDTVRIGIIRPYLGTQTTWDVIWESQSAVIPKPGDKGLETLQVETVPTVIQDIGKP
ncbi:hypothetical protein CERZMDRAFT_96584 [Cercospora zeae-maydis SCOH1-5]|uniref:Uncharacterized protein n=1 Tax=Cercospora zeae-maydis SCOH1-5 TaxID=717836 RepID=A0A6A6FJZ9_9PEZI|nr:hypothetical protein CERZMDRAFT_96584 [Cercospora zeae-maydis SCOH1-5]